MKNTIETFYAALARLDGEGMAACYHPDIVFTDPAFGTLHGVHAGNMWRMLCESQRGKNFTSVASAVTANAEGGKAHVEVDYIFSRTGRPVHNKIDGQFTFQDGKIIRHIDHFNLYRWAQQAMGTTGYLIGWTGFFQKKLQVQTRQLLAKYEQRKAGS